MKLNDYGFPDYMELYSKFNLKHESELKECFEFMYTRYNSLYKATHGMSPEQIKFLYDLYLFLRSIYSSKLEIDELRGCPAEGQYKEIMGLFEDEPDKHEAVQKLFEVYMKDRARDFKYGIETLLR